MKLAAHLYARSPIVLRLVGALAISVAALIVYQPALRGGFWTDDYRFLEAAGRLTGLDYWALYFDPFLRIDWYRPMHGAQWWIGFALFGNNAIGYHALQNLLHVMNCLLLYALVAHFSRSWRVGFAAGLIYAVMPLAALAVLWLGVSDPIMTTWILLAIAFWTRYLERGNRAIWILTVIACANALLSKEPAIALPCVLLLVDFWLVARPATWFTRLRRNAIFFFLLAIYLALEFVVLRTSVFPRSSGYGIGINLLSNLITYASWLVLPWESDAWMRYVLLVVVCAVMIGALVKRAYRLLFLGVAALLGLVAVLPFPGYYARYAYMPLLASAAGFGSLFNAINVRMKQRWAQAACAVAFLLLVILSGAQTIAGAENFAEASRLARLQFRPIFQSHAGFLPDTVLYFINPPFPTYNISGLMFSRYGANVIVAGDDTNTPPRFRDHAGGFVFAFDDQGHELEYVVKSDTVAQITPALPAQFGNVIALDGLEVSSTRVKSDESLVLFLNWRGIAKIEQDYTVFVHLVDARGNIVAGYDSSPKRGTHPTSGWEPGALIVDAVVVPIEDALPAGEDLRMRIGLYFAPTGERLSILNARGERIGDAIELEPFSVTP